MASHPSDREAATASRLRWRCRRGMRELDTLLERWLSECWPQADSSVRTLFERLLDCEDDQLWDWCMGRSAPDDPNLAALVDQIVDPSGHSGTAGERGRLGR